VPRRHHIGCWNRTRAASSGMPLSE
jgi:hypothetical protein